jgi:hypothetical protein
MTKKLLGLSHGFPKVEQPLTPHYWLQDWVCILSKIRFRKVAGSNTSCLEAKASFFWLPMQGIFDRYVLWPFDKELIS